MTAVPDVRLNKCAEHHIAVEAWSPIAQGQVLDDPAIALIAERVRKSPAQVVLRWHTERGDIVALNKDERTGPDPDIFDMIPD